MTTARFKSIGAKGIIYLPDHRINFQSGLGKKGKSPAFGSIILKLGEEWNVKQITKEDVCF